MLRIAAARLRAMLGSMGAQRWSPDAASQLAPRLAWPAQGPAPRSLHAARTVAQAQRPTDRSERYGVPQQQPQQPAAHPPQRTAASSAKPAPRQQAPARPPPPVAAATPPAQAAAASAAPASQPPQRSGAQQGAAAAVVSEDYGVPVRPGAGRMVLVDALPLLYKAHFAFPPDARLHSALGVDTTVIYVFLNMLLNLLSLQPPPTHFAVVFDASGKNFRHELYADYKGQRPEAPPEIREAIPRLRELLAAMAVPVFSVPGVEADDVLGTLAVRGVQEGMVVAIASPDKDFFQLLRFGLILLRPPKKQQYQPGAAGEGQQQEAAQAAGQQGGAGERRVSKFMLLPYTEEDFKEEWGLEPAQFVDLLALAGDSSDNVPGVAGIGPKTAAGLLRRFPTLEELLANAAEVPKRAGAALQSPEGAAAARLSKQLVRIETALDLPPLQVLLEELRLRPPQDGGAAILALCDQLDLKTHEERLKRLWAGPAYRLATAPAQR